MKTILPLLSILLTSLSAPAQVNSPATVLYNEIKRLNADGKVDSCITLLNKYIAAEGDKQKAEAYIELGYIYLKDKKDIVSAKKAFLNSDKTNSTLASRAALSIVFQFDQQWQDIVNILEKDKYEKDFTIGAPHQGMSPKFLPRAIILKTYVYGLANLDEFQKIDLYLYNLFVNEKNLLVVFELKGDIYMSKEKWTDAAKSYQQYVDEYEANLKSYNEIQKKQLKPSQQLFDRLIEALQNSGQTNKITAVREQQKKYY
jgi:hypothetical protein